MWTFPQVINVGIIVLYCTGNTVSLCVPNQVVVLRMNVGLFLVGLIHNHPLHQLLVYKTLSVEILLLQKVHDLELVIFVLQMRITVKQEIKLGFGVLVRIREVVLHYQ